MWGAVKTARGQEVPSMFAQDICGHLPSSSLADSGHTCVGVDYPKVGGREEGGWLYPPPGELTN